MDTKFSKMTGWDKAIMIFAYTVLGLFMAAIILPGIYIILASFIDPITLQNSGLTFDFSKWTLTAYERVMSNSQIWIGFKNALIYSVLFTIISVAVTLLAAYPMSRPDFKGKGFYNTVFVITMFFGGGLIPTYLLISDLGGYHLGNSDPRCIQRMEYDYRSYLLYGHSPGHAGSCRDRWCLRNDLLLQNPAASVHAHHCNHRHVAVRRDVEQLL